MKLKDKVLRKEWIVACKAEEVMDEPKKVVIMGESVVLYRTEEGVHALRDLCIHRGAALSLGCIKGDKLVCPYHAWEFNKEGVCTKIPQLPEGKAIPLKARVEKYGCIERYGLIFVNLENENPDLFEYKEFEDSSMHHVIWISDVVLANPPRIIENFLDVSHLAFVHQDYLGSPDKAIIGDHKVHKGPNSIYSDEISVFQPDSDGTGVTRDMSYKYEILNPLTTRFRKYDVHTNECMCLLITVLPVEEEKSIIYGIISVDYDNRGTDDEMREFQDMIFAQDKPIVENQKPENLPLDLQVELSLKCDALSIAYRKYLVELGVTYGTA